MPMKTAITFAAFFDLFLLLVLSTLNFILLHNYGVFWCVALVVADITLICGVMANKANLMILWLIICMINIVFLFIGWIAIPLIIFLSSLCDTVNSDSNFYYESSTDYYTTSTRTFCAEETRIGMWVAAGFVMILPIYYLYLWIVVKSHRKNLIEQQRGAQPIPGYQGQQMFVMSNNGTVLPQQTQQPQIIPGPNPTTMYYQPTPLDPKYQNTNHPNYYNAEFGGLYGNINKN